jgi:hypothetical protein
MSSMVEFLVWALWLGVGGVLVALVACAFGRWRVASSAAAGAVALTGLLCLLLIGGSVVRSAEPIDPSLKATLLASGISEAANAGLMALAVALLGGPVWFFARRRDRATRSRNASTEDRR